MKGLSATELAQAVRELEPTLCQAVVRDLARLADRDDLLLFLDHPDGDRALHLVPGGPRARITFTKRRFRKDEFQSGPLIDRLQLTLRGSRFESASVVPGERCCRLALRTESGDAIALECELFGARGLWCLVDSERRIRELSRLPDIAGRTLRPGAVYAPPEPRADAPTGPEPRFTAPVLEAIDDAFTQFDRDDELQTLRRKLDGVLTRAARKLQHKIDGLARQRESIARIPELRQQADMLLAYGFQAGPNASQIEVPHPEDPEQTITYRLDPGVPIQAQADKLYKKARKLKDSAAISEQRQSEAKRALAPVHACRAEFDAAETLDQLFNIQDRLAKLGLLPRAKRHKPVAPDAKQRQIQKITKGFQFRRFASIEGYLILVGRTNHENDRLSVSVARGNDLWFHVGQGYAGSHVVMRVPKEKTASLESLLDAATLALHFSKARNADRCEVIYTPAKHVRKPKGLPPGKVTVGQSKTLFVQKEADRLQRVLDSTTES